MAPRSRAGVEPVRTSHVTPAASSSGPRLCAYWRARTSVGAIMSACVPESDTAAERVRRHDGLAGAHVAELHWLIGRG